MRVPDLGRESASPRASHQVKNRVTAAAYAARVCGLRVWAVKNSTVRSAACGPARRMVAGRPSICQPPGRTSAADGAAIGARAGARGGVGCVGSVPDRRSVPAARRGGHDRRSWSCHGQIVT